MLKTRFRSLLGGAAGLACVITLSGCGGGPASALRMRPASDGVMTGLVLPGDSLLEASLRPGGGIDPALARELAGRNDTRLGLIDRATGLPMQRSVTQTYDRQWTINGRTGETTYTRTRSIRVSPSN